MQLPHTSQSNQATQTFQVKPLSAKLVSILAIATMAIALTGCGGGGGSSLAVTPGSSSNGSDTDIGSGSGSGSGAGTSNDSGSGNGSGTANGSGTGTGTGTDNTPTPSGETPVTPVPTVNSVNPATSFNVKGATVLYTTAQAISSAQLNAGLLRSSRALPTFVSGKNTAAKNGLMAGLAGNSNAFNLVAVTSDGISHQAIESPYLSRVLYTVSPSSINQTDERRFVDPNVYIAFSSDPIEGDSNDYSQFILKTVNQPCALYYVNTGNNSQGCALPNVEPTPYFGSDFGKVDGSNRKPLQFDSEGNIYVVGKPFTVSNEKIIKKPYARLYKIQRGTFAATPLTQDNESVAFFTVLASGEPVVAISRQTGFDLAVFVTKNGATARRTIASQISEPFINLDTYRTLFYGSSAGNNKAVNIVRTSESNLERAVINYNTGTPTGYNLTVSSTTYSSLIPRRVISGDDGNFYTVFSATAANSDSALLIYQTLPFKRDAVAAIPVTGEWWTWMKNRPLQIKRGVLYYATTQDRANIGSVDIIKVVRLTDGTTQSLFADKNYRIDSWKALGDTLHFSGIDNDTNQVVQGQVNTKKIAQQRDWSAAAWQNLIPATVTPSASARASSILVEDLESLAPQQPQTDTGMAPAIVTIQSTDKSAALTFTKYMYKTGVESKLHIVANQGGTTTPALFPVWGYQNLHLVYDTSNGLSDNQTTGLPTGSGSYQISAEDLPDAYGWSIANIYYMVSETQNGTYSLVATDSVPSAPTVSPAVVDITRAASGTQAVSISGNGFTLNSIYQISTNHGTWTNGTAGTLSFNNANSMSVTVDKTLPEGTFLRLRVCSSSSANASCSNDYVTINIGNTQSSGNRYIAVGSFAKEECVKDDATGLIWEGKTAGGSRADTNYFTNFDSTSSPQKWGGPGLIYINPTQADIDAGNNSIAYIKTINSTALCGFTDWRLPTNNELLAILDSNNSSPAINRTWFPNTSPHSLYWTSTSTKINLDNGSYVDDALYVHFYEGYNGASLRVGGKYTIRLVRSSNSILAAPVVTHASVDVTPAASGTQAVSISGSGFTANSVYQISENHEEWINGETSTLTFHSTASLTVAVDKSWGEGNFLRLRVCSNPNVEASCSNNYIAVNFGNTQSSGNRYIAVGSYAKEECVKDDATGLVWEGKTTIGIRSSQNLYTNYNSTFIGQKSNGVFPTQAEIDASTNSIGYKNMVNNIALCGFTDWRLPNFRELLTINDSSRSNPSINTTWFPNMQGNGYGYYYWSSASIYSFNDEASTVIFNNSNTGDSKRYALLPLRLVRKSK